MLLLRVPLCTVPRPVRGLLTPMRSASLNLILRALRDIVKKRNARMVSFPYIHVGLDEALPGVTKIDVLLTDEGAGVDDVLGALDQPPEGVSRDQIADMWKEGTPDDLRTPLMAGVLNPALPLLLALWKSATRNEGKHFSSAKLPAKKKRPSSRMILIELGRGERTQLAAAPP